MSETEAKAPVARLVAGDRTVEYELDSDLFESWAHAVTACSRLLEVTEDHAGARGLALRASRFILNAIEASANRYLAAQEERSEGG